MTTPKRLEALRGFREAIIWARRQEGGDAKERDRIVKFLTTQAARETPVDPIAEKMLKTNKYYCPECDATVQTRTKYCAECGQKLSWQILRGGKEDG